jgi:hypothetical protein
MKAYHYTTHVHLALIKEEGKLRSTAKLLDPGEKPVVWASLNPLWEETARKSIFYRGEQTPPLRHDEMLDLGIIPIRIELNPVLPFVTWEEFKRISGITETSALRLEHIAILWKANPQEWLASFQPIIPALWLQVEYWNGQIWRTVADNNQN